MKKLYDTIEGFAGYEHDTDYYESWMYTNKVDSKMCNELYFSRQNTERK